jgi:CheY-like chemotaxis protein
MADTDMVRVQISDTGSGIDRDDLNRIWKPFEQADDPDTRSTGGSGLGLAITKHLVEMHGGRIWAESVKGKGSTFTLELPLKATMPSIKKTKISIPPDLYTVAASIIRDSTSGEQKPADPIKTKYPSAAILAVEDDQINMKILKNICQSAGYNLFAATSGPEALNTLDNNDIDLVLLDLMLPGMSGFEVCQKIRRMEKSRYIPVIMLTARDHMGDLMRGFETGANDYINKPYRRQELLLRIESQLAIKQLLDMEDSIISGLQKEKEAITSLFQRSVDIKESTLQMIEWEKVIKEDLNIARAFQQKFMTHANNIPGIESCIRYHPLLEVGGDLYDIFELKPGVVRIFMADATGHGITASLNTVKILSEYAALKEILGSPAQVLNFLNQRFTKSLSNYMIIFTCLIADIDLEASTVTIASAGLPEQYLLHSSNITKIESLNPILGISETIVYCEKKYEFNTGNILFFYTDGLWDMVQRLNAGNLMNAMNENDILAEQIKHIYTNERLEMAATILYDYFGSRKNIKDDVTFIALKKT